MAETKTTTATLNEHLRDDLRRLAITIICTALSIGAFTILEQRTKFISRYVVVPEVSQPAQPTGVEANPAAPPLSPTAVPTAAE